LGDFYQWGRIADGHQHIVWSKNPTTRANQITPMTGGSSATAATSGKPPSGFGYTATGQIPNDASGAGYYGKFIVSTSDWGIGNTTLWRRWGNGAITRASSAEITPESGWTHGAANNPCPDGWHIPSRHNLWDIYGGNGSDDPSSSNYTGSVNTWQWRLSSNNAYGGVVITNSNGNKVFLPAVGRRHNSMGTLVDLNTGYYWSSTGGGSWYYLYFDGSSVSAGNASIFMAYGHSVRCVKFE